jgi:hypothetical protein
LKRLLSNGLLVLLTCLYLGGCMEMIRRSPAPRPVGAGTSGNQSEQTDVQKPETAATQPTEDTAVVAVPKPAPREAMERTGQKQVAQIYRPGRNRQQQKIIKQVNEYAFWCIENDMWTEARLHLEQGLQQDSLSASIHNNLGIVYERLGLREKAATAYGKAQALNQGKKAYQINFKLFDGRRQSGLIDSTQVEEEPVEEAADPFGDDDGGRPYSPAYTGD